MRCEIIKLKSFSLAEALIAMLVVGILLAATLPLLLMKKKLDGRDIKSINCIVNDLGNITSASCSQAINKCTYGQNNSCNNILYYADLGSSEQKDYAKTVLKEVCDQGGEIACNYFLKQCKKDVNNCDIAAENYDLQYYLNLPIDSENLGKISLLESGLKFYTAGYANITATVDSFTCCPDLTLACSIRGITSCGAPPPPPSQPGGAAGTPGENTVDLSWTDSDTETGYKIMQSTDGTNYSEIAAIGADATSYQVTGLSPTTNYWFKVVAYNAGGQTESNVVSTTTTSGTPPSAAWQKLINNSTGSSDEAGGMIMDNSGNIYITGRHGFSMAALKMNANGNVIWAQRIQPSANNINSRAITTDNSGNIYITGYYNNAGDYDIILINMDSNGNLIWQKLLKSSNNEGAEAIAIDNSGNIYITGFSNNGTDNDIALIKTNSSGNILWDRRFNSSDVSSDGGYGITKDNSGNIYIAGYSNNGSNFDIAVVKTNSSGTKLWDKRFNASNSQGNYDFGTGINIDNGGNIYILGCSNNGAYDIAVIKMDSDGTKLWEKRYNSSDEFGESGNGITTDNSGNIYITGYSNAGTGSDLEILKMNSAGTMLWDKRFGFSTLSESGQAIKIDSSGYVYVLAHNYFSYYDLVVIKMSNAQTSDNRFSTGATFLKASGIQTNVFTGIQSSIFSTMDFVDFTTVNPGYIISSPGYTGLE